MRAKKFDVLSFLLLFSVEKRSGAVNPRRVFKTLL